MMTESNYLKELRASLHTKSEADFVFSFTGETGAKKSRRYAANKISELAKTATNTKKWPFDIKPYDHQKEILRATASHLSDEKKPNTGYTVVPTGGGKTFVFAHIVNSLSKSFRLRGDNHKIPPPTIILVPTEDLVDQTLEAFQGFSGLEVGQYYGKQKQIRPVTVMVYNSFVDAVDKGWIKPGDISMLMMDEAHRGLSDLRQDIFDKFKRNTLMLAYTATPEFDENKNIDALFGRNSHIYTITTRQLINEKKLSPVDNYVLRVNLTFAPGAKPASDQELRQLIRIAKMKAAAEFMLEYEDPETGEMLLGDTTLGFLSPSSQNSDQSYVRLATRYFNETLRERAAHDPFVASGISSYAHIAEAMGSAVGDSKDVLQRLRLGNTLAAFSVRYGREGSDIRRATNLLNIHGSSSSLDVRQAGGRVLRLWEDNPNKRAKILDCYATIDGKHTNLDAPVFYYKALGDESILREVLDTDIHIDEQTKNAYLAEVKRLETVETPPKPKHHSEVGDFLDEKELSHRVLGDGDAKIKYNSPLRHVLGKMRKHYERQIYQPSPVPYIVAGQAVTVQKAPPTSRNSKEKILVNENTIDALRSAIRFPPHKTSAWLDKEEGRVCLFGTGKLAEDFSAAYDNWWKAYAKHYEREKFRVEKRSRLVRMQPFQYKGHEIPCNECLDARGNLQLVVSAQALSVLREMLESPKAHGPGWCNKEQFMHAMLTELPQTEIYRQDVEEFWQNLEVFANAKPIKYKTRMYHTNGHEFPFSFTLNYDGELSLSIWRASIRAIRKILDIPAPEWSANGHVDNGGKVFYNSGLSHSEQIKALRFNNGDVPEKTHEWLSIADAAKKLRKSHNDRLLNEAFAALKEVHDATPNEEPVNVGEREIRCGIRSYRGNSLFCIHVDDINWISDKISGLQAAEIKTNEWLNAEDVMRELAATGNGPKTNALVNLSKRMMIAAKQKARKHEPVTIDGQPLTTTFKRHENGHPMFCIDRPSFERLRNKLESFMEAKTSYIEVGPAGGRRPLDFLIGAEIPEIEFFGLNTTEIVHQIQDQFVQSLGENDVIHGIPVTLSEGKLVVREDGIDSLIRLLRLRAAEALQKRKFFDNFDNDEERAAPDNSSDIISCDYKHAMFVIDEGGVEEPIADASGILMRYDYAPGTLVRFSHNSITYATGRVTHNEHTGIRLSWDDRILKLRFEEVANRLACKRFAKPQIFDRFKFQDGKIFSTWEDGKTRLVTPDGNKVEDVDNVIRAHFEAALKRSKEIEPWSDLLPMSLSKQVKSAPALSTGP